MVQQEWDQSSHLIMCLGLTQVVDLLVYFKTGIKFTLGARITALPPPAGSVEEI